MGRKRASIRLCYNTHLHHPAGTFKHIPAVPIRLLDITFTSLLDKKRSKMHAKFSTIGRLAWSNEFKLIALICVIFSIKMLYESDKNGYRNVWRFS